MKDEVVIQRGHNITYGGPISQNIALTGARVVEVGLVTECGAYQLTQALCDRTAAAVYVVSHHTAPFGLIDLATFCRVCKEQNVPVIVDGATEPDPRIFLRAGADLVITSMHKSFAGITGATVAGRLDLVRACVYQEKGIARPMKVGKEGVIGAIAAVERWRRLDRPAIRGALDARLDRGREALARLPGLSVSIELDATSRAYSRLLVGVDPGRAGLDAYTLSAELANQTPSIAVRNLMAESGLLQIDFRFIDDKTAQYVIESIEQIVGRAQNRAQRDPLPAASPNLADAVAARLARFPLPMNERFSADGTAR